MLKTIVSSKSKVSHSQISTGFVSKMAELRNYRILILNNIEVGFQAPGI